MDVTGDSSVFKSVLPPKEFVSLSELNEIKLWKNIQALEQLSNSSIFMGNELQNLGIRYCHNALGIAKHLMGYGKFKHEHCDPAMKLTVVSLSFNRLT